jgi:NAD-dependent dihydropyrimidine dehydrogenase PreA subunit
MRKIGSNRISGLKGRRVSGNGLDTYMDAHKREGVSVCSTCRAVHERGKWRWTDAPKGAEPMVCPACRRIEDRCPAHLLRLDDVPQDQRSELVAMIHNTADEEARLHPIERLMWLQDGKQRIEVALTGAHIARRLRAAIARSWRGRFASKLGVEQTELRWKLEPKKGGKRTVVGRAKAARASS